MTVLDEHFLARYREAERIAQHGGRDLLETLDGLGLLATPQLLHRAKVDVLTDVYHRMEEQGATRILHFSGKQHGTPDDMFRATLDWLELVVRSTADKKI